jgi:hypothetical protein
MPCAGNTLADRFAAPTPLETAFAPATTAVFDPNQRVRDGIKVYLQHQGLPPE